MLWCRSVESADRLTVVEKESLVSLFSVRWKVSCVHNHVRIVHSSSEQAIVDLPRCLVQKRIVCFVLALMHGLACCPHLLLVGLF